MSTPAGWYDDGGGAQRFWDGGAWTALVAYPVPDAAAPVGEPRKSRVGLYVGIGAAALLLGLPMTVSIGMVLLQHDRASGPGRAFDAIVAAWKAKDCPAEYRLSYASTTETTQEAFCQDVDYAWVDAYDQWDVEVTKVDESLGTATVATFETYKDFETGDTAWEKRTYTFERVDGKWYFVSSELVE